MLTGRLSEVHFSKYQQDKIASTAKKRWDRPRGSGASKITITFNKMLLCYIAVLYGSKI